jgi:3-hydroxyacyl-CoA dehydrogenase
MKIKSVLVVGGAGYMGSGIVQACAQAGYDVFVSDPSAPALARALNTIEWSVRKLSSKNAITEPSSAVMNRIKIAEGLGVASSVDWIIETVPEIEDLKVSLIQQLDELVKPEVPIGTNTSSIPIHRIADKSKYPGRIVGTHFFMPIFRVGIIEVIKGDSTSPEIFERACAFVESLGKRPVRVMKDIPGFVYNRIFGAAFKQAIDLVEQGVITPEEVDLGMRDAYGWQLGPFQMADAGGLDTFVNGFRSYKARGQDVLVPQGDLMDKMVSEGRLGKKTGQGFYKYNVTK